MLLQLIRSLEPQLLSETDKSVSSTQCDRALGVPVASREETKGEAACRCDRGQLRRHLTRVWGLGLSHVSLSWSGSLALGVGEPIAWSGRPWNR